MSDKKVWKTLEKKEVFKCPFFTLFSEKCETFQKKTLNDYYRMELVDWVQVVVETEDDQLLLIRQYRHGDKQEHIEIVGGVCDPGEDPLAAAKRELLEEAGYASENWTLLGSSKPNPAIQNNTMFSYFAKNAKKVSEQNLDPFEDIDVFSIPKADLRDYLLAGNVKHSLVLMSLFWYLSKEG